MRKQNKLEKEDWIMIPLATFYLHLNQKLYETLKKYEADVAGLLSTISYQIVDDVHGMETGPIVLLPRHKIWSDTLHGAMEYQAVKWFLGN